MRSPTPAPGHDGIARSAPARTPARGTAPPPAGAAALATLQRAAGNAAVVQMLRQSGHAWAQAQAQRSVAGPGTHRHGAGCGHAAEESAAAVQRSEVHDVLRSAGRPLEAGLRADMEARLGADFGDVRIHDDSAARRSAAEIGARAYTSGSHVVIGDGGADRHTLAHELTHVIQQRRGPVAGTDNGAGLSISDPGDRFEREAEANAVRAMASVPSPARDAHPAAPPAADEPAPAPVQRMNAATAAPAPAPAPAPVPQGQAPAPAVPTLDSIDFGGGIPLDGFQLTRWESGFPLTANLTYRTADTPSAVVAVSGLGTSAARVQLQAWSGNQQVGESSFVAPIPGQNLFLLSALRLPVNGVGTTVHGVSWRLVRENAPGQGQEIDTTAHDVHRLYGTPQTHARADAVVAAMSMLAGQTDAQAVATALRHSLRMRVQYDPSDPINDDPLTVLTDGRGVCADYANLLVLLAQTVGLPANTVMVWGGFFANDQMVWAGGVGNMINLTNVQALDTQWHPGQAQQGWDFQYHAIARVGGVLHDAALDRDGFDGQAVHAGRRVAFHRFGPGDVLPDGAEGTRYAWLIPREEETVAVTAQDYGDQAQAAFPAHVLEIPPNTTGTYFAPVLTLAAGALPPGLSLDATGMIQGVPTLLGAYSFTVRAGTNGPTRQFTLTVWPQ
ncbi:eCIS core domain-containing protein [Streptomyces globosus]|uniref:eCIS core domain-containing protein n=2 Tax=Streptomyces TaxID=1883 RepID=UPI0031D58AD2